jgi:hypothetical protein
MVDQSFLGRVFDSYQNMTQIAACIREVGRQRALARPRVLELSRRETGLGDYLPDAERTRFATHEDERPTLPTPVVLPFGDRAFDCCLVTDVYEHIAAEQRPELLAEMLRVTDGLVIVAAPHGNALVSRLDRLVFDFIWGKYGDRFVPLEQHAAFGLEPIEETVATLKRLGADEVVVLPGNYVYRWIHMILVYFDLQHGNPYGGLFEPMNRIYNEYLSPYDYREPCYRYMIAIPTHPGIDARVLDDALRRPSDARGPAEATDAMLVRTFREIDSAAADRLREASRHIENLLAENARKDAELADLRARVAAHQQGVLGRARGLVRRLVRPRPSA